MSATTATTIAEHWGTLVTTSLLGTDRREPPAPPPGPIADLVADATRPTASGRMLAAVAACTAVRRAAFCPLPAAPPLMPPSEPDDRPLVPTGVAVRWRAIVTRWPVLEDEWLDAVAAGGWRLSPDLLVDLLRRHRGDSRRRARVEALAGSIAPWLVGHRPELAAAGGRRPPDADGRPVLAVNPDLLTLLDADAATVVDALTGGLVGGRFGPPHRAVLVNLIARLRADLLEPTAVALRAIDPGTPAIGLALLLADLATVRHEMLVELDAGGRDG